jgi:hypothetical protein
MLFRNAQLIHTLIYKKLILLNLRTETSLILEWQRKTIIEKTFILAFSLSLIGHD